MADFFLFIPKPDMFANPSSSLVKRLIFLGLLCPKTASSANAHAWVWWIASTLTSRGL